MVTLAERRRLAASRRDYLRVVVTELERPRRVALMVRVSTEEQSERETYKVQIDTLEALARARQLDSTPDRDRVHVVHRIVDDGVSGTKPLSERSDGRRLIGMVCSRADEKCRGECGGGSGVEIDEVWATRLDRVARRLQLLMEIHVFLESHGVKLVIDDPHIDTSDEFGKLLFNILGAIAEWERDIIAKRTAQGRRSKVALGRWKGGLLPFWLSTDENANILVEDRLIDACKQSASDLMRDIIRRITSHEVTPQEECLRLTALGVPLQVMPSLDEPGVLVAKPNKKTRADGAWRPSQLRDLLHDTKLAGYYKMDIYARDRNGKRIKGEDGKWIVQETIESTSPALISQEDYDALQAAIDENSHLPPPNASRTYLLSGLIRCGRPNCGYTWSGFTAKDPGSKGPEDHFRTDGSRGGPGSRGGKGRKAGTWSYYQCSAGSSATTERHQDGRGCTTRSGIRALEIEGAVWAIVEAIVRNPQQLLERAQAEIDARRADVPARDARLVSIRERQYELSRERERVEMAHQKGRSSWARTERELDHIDAQVAELTRERAMLESNERMLDSMNARLQRSGVVIAEYRDKLDDLDDERKRELIRLFVPEVVALQSGRKWKARVVVDLGALVEREATAALGALVTACGQQSFRGANQPEVANYRRWVIEQAQAAAQDHDPAARSLQFEVALSSSSDQD